LLTFAFNFFPLFLVTIYYCLDFFNKEKIKDVVFGFGFFVLVVFMILNEVFTSPFGLRKLVGYWREIK